MPQIGFFHPQLVYFAVVFGIVGVLLRLMSLTVKNSPGARPGLLNWTNPAARSVLIAAGRVDELLKNLRSGQ